MSQHPSLKSNSAGSQHRNVLKRYERIKKLKTAKKWQEEENSVFGLPKVKSQKIKAKAASKAEKKPDEEIVFIRRKIESMFEIKKFRSEYQDQVSDMIENIMSNEFAEDRRAYPLDDLKDISKTYGNIGEAFFVGIEDGNVVGSVAVKKEDERTAFLRRIFVSPEYRNRRYGMRLLEEAIHFCSVVGYQEIVFKTTSKMKRAINLCAKKGFVEKARLDLGGLELYKFALFLKENSPLA